MQTGGEGKINSPSSAISTKCGEQLEIIKQKLRKARLFISNVPEEITIEKATTIVKAQNPEITPKREDIVAKFSYKNRKGIYNITIEVDPHTRKQILQTKLKIGWDICNVEDYLVPTRCSRCSRYNHQHNDCKGD